MKIILSELSSNAAGDNKMQQKFETLSKTYKFFIITKSISEINNCNLLIKHGTLQNFKREEGYWYIETGGNKGDIIPTEKKQPGSISWNTLTENIEIFLSNIKNSQDLTKEDIATLYSIDPVLENILVDNFININPLEKDPQKLNAYKMAKKDLQAYISKKMEEKNK